MARPTLPDQFVRKPFTALGRALPSAARGDVEALHQARVASRRLRAVVPLLDADRKARRQILRQLRRLTRQLGAMRELDVALANVRELEGEQRTGKTALARLRLSLEAERGRREPRFRGRVERWSVKKLRTQTLDLVRRSTRTAVLDNAQTHVRRRAGTLRVLIEGSGQTYASEQLHEVRIAVKKLRYTLEATAAITDARAVSGAAQLKHTQDVLGRIHDFEVLAERLREQDSESDGALARAGGEQPVVRSINRECRSLHRRYLSGRAGVLRLCNRLERTSVRKSGS